MTYQDALERGYGAIGGYSDNATGKRMTVCAHGGIKINGVTDLAISEWRKAGMPESMILDRAIVVTD